MVCESERNVDDNLMMVMMGDEHDYDDDKAAVVDDCVQKSHISC
jgi:hypothetical protein